MENCFIKMDPWNLALYHNWIIWIVFCQTVNGWSVSSFILLMSDRIINSWSPVMHKCIGNLTIIYSDIGLSPCWHQAIIWTNAGILLIGNSRTNFSEIFVKIYRFSFKKMHLKMLSAKWWPSCLGLNVLTAAGFSRYDVNPEQTSFLSNMWSLIILSPS